MNDSKLLRIVIGLMLFISMANSGHAQMSNDNIKMKQLVDIITEKQSNILMQFPDGNVFSNLEMMPEYHSLVTMSASSWSSALDNLSTIAPSKQSRIVLLQSFQDLSSQDYLAFANRSLDLLAENRIETPEFFYNVLMSPTKKRWFLSYNYQDPGVIGFLNRVRLRFAKDPKILDLVDFILSGKARTRDEILRKENRYFAAQSIDLLPGSSMPTPSQKTTVRQGEGAITPKPETSQVPIVAARQSSFPIVPVGILVLAIIGVAVFFLRRKSS